MKTTRRRMMFLAVKSVLSLIGVFAITVLVHEGAHYLTALALNVPIAYFRWFDFKYFAPVFVSASKDNTVGMTAVGYAGGLVAGLLLLSILILKRNWLRQSLYGWLIGFYLITFGSWQISQGILEGAFHQVYISNTTNIFSLTYYISFASAFLGMALYWVLMPRLTNLRV